MAQSGSALVWGTRGRRFKSGQPDEYGSGIDGFQRSGWCGSLLQMELDHIYRETVEWDRSVTFWETLGFTFVDQWGSEPHRAGTLVCGEASIVLAEVKTAPSSSVFVTTADLEAVSEATETPIVDTHWGTRMVSVTDPDGRTYNFEPRRDAS